jgi:hypothetical protein
MSLLVIQLAYLSCISNMQWKGDNSKITVFEKNLIKIFSASMCVHKFTLNVYALAFGYHRQVIIEGFHWFSYLNAI